MVKKGNLVCLLIMLVFALQGQPGPDDYAEFKGGESERIDTEIVVPFEIIDSAHRITVKADFDGTELELILDTGGQTFLEKGMKDSLGLDSFTIPANNSEFAVIKTINLGGVKVNNMKAGLIDFEDTFKFDLIGMIGSDFLRFYQVGIDYKQQQLSFSQNKELMKQDDKDHFSEIEIIFPYFPTVEMKLGKGRIYPGMIDTGLHYAFVFPASWIENLDDEEKEKLIEADGYFARWPWHEDPDNFLYKMDEIVIGDLVLHNVPVIFSEIPVFLNDKVALIGKFFLENYLTTIDYPNKQVNFREVQEEKYSLTYSAGIMLADKEDKLQITGVWQNSPAAEQGLSPENELLAVAGKKYGEINNKEIIEILMNPEISEVSIQILQDGKVKDITLEKRELLP